MSIKSNNKFKKIKKSKKKIKKGSSYSSCSRQYMPCTSMSKYPSILSSEIPRESCNSTLSLYRSNSYIHPLTRGVHVSINKNIHPLKKGIKVLNPIRKKRNKLKSDNISYVHPEIVKREKGSSKRCVCPELGLTPTEEWILYERQKKRNKNRDRCTIL